jgi:hypothetical protein
MYGHKPSMDWEASLLEFVFSMMIELVKSGASCTMASEKARSRRLSMMFLDFSGITVITL